MRAARAAGLALVLAFALGPLAWTGLASLTPEEEVLRRDGVLPSRLSLESYRAVFAPERRFGRALANSAAVALATTAAALALGGAAAFAITKLELPGARAILGAALGVSMFPPIATVAPLFLIVRALGLRDTLPGLVLPYTALALPLAVWNLAAFFRDVPDDLYRAARVDGCSPLGALVRVVLPVAAPGVATTAILVFIFAWNEFLYAVTFTSTERARTVPVAIALFAGAHEVPWAELAAASTIVTAPLVLCVLAAQGRIRAGLAAGAVKG
jgi:multiple sugar transport system permease protein